MKMQTFVVLVALIVSILTPVSINFSPAANGTALVSLDVCSAGAHSLAPNSESVCLSESLVTVRLFELTSTVAVVRPVLKPLLFAFKKDRPPQI